MKFIIQAGKERLESNGGLVLGGKVLSGLGLDRRVNGIIIDGALEPKLTNADVLRSYFGLHAELRVAAGTQRCQKGTPEFLRETFCWER